MINLSDEPIFIGRGTIDTQVKFACKQLTDCMVEQDALRSRKGENPKNRAFKSLINKQIKEFDKDFLQIAFKYSNQTKTPKTEDEISRLFFEYFGSHSLSAMNIGFLRADISVLYMQLWLNGDLILPISYKVIRNRKYTIPEYHELHKFIDSFFQPEVIHEPRQHSGDRIFYYASRVLRSTNWRRFQDFKIEDWAQFHVLSKKGENDGNFLSFNIPKVPWTGLLNQLLLRYPNDIQFNLDDVKAYSEWSYMSPQTSDFKAFRENWTPNAVKVKDRAPRKRALRTINAPSADDKYKDSLKAISGKLSHDSILEYIRKLKPNQKFISPNNDGLSYVGREFVDIKSLSQTWTQLFQQFKQYRVTHLGYESDKGLISSLNLLIDYICLYLPWWKELHPDSDVGIPSCPKQFKRAFYVHRSGEYSIDKMPLSLVDIIQIKRTSPNSVYSALIQILLFFSYLESHHSEDEGLVGVGFRNPISKFDLPKLKKRSKTSKLNFPQRTAGYLQYFAYSVEAFGEFLYEMSINPSNYQVKSKFNKVKLASAIFLDAQDFGYIPIFFFRGKAIPIFMVPNVFNWKSSVISTKVGLQSDKFIPYLTIIRAFILGIENGLRFASIRWLDKNTWDELNVGEPIEPDFSYYPKSKYSFKLSVNTDKVKEEKWQTPMVYRVRSMLHREEIFWSNIIIPDNETGEVPYQSREVSRFPNVLPLFKSSRSKMPISENIVQEYWVIFMAGFQSLFNRITSGEDIKFVYYAPIGGDKSKTAINKDSGCLFTPLTLFAVTTPHGCRSTFCTDKGQFLEVDDVANMVGHQSSITTHYYQSLRSEDALRKFEDLDKSLMKIDSSFYDENKSNFLRSDGAEGHIAKKLLNDREGAIANLGFIQSTPLWSMADTDEQAQSTDGLAMLKESPMSNFSYELTHICPVGGVCPEEVIKKLNGKRKCGTCDLAMKCIDHLPAISAKKNELIEKIQYLSKRIEVLTKKGEHQAAESLWEEQRDDATQYIGWRFSEDQLLLERKAMVEAMKDKDVNQKYIANEPELIKKHISVVARDETIAEFYLHRLAESNAYPALASQRVEAFSAKIIRVLQSSTNLYSEINIDTEDPITLAARGLKVMMDAKNLTVEQVSHLLVNQNHKMIENS